MPGLRDIVLSRDMVLQMQPQDLAQILLSLVCPFIQNGIFTSGPVGQVQSGRGYNHFGYVDGGGALAVQHLQAASSCLVLEEDTRRVREAASKDGARYLAATGLVLVNNRHDG
jgi:hypothetical protein